MQDLTAFAERMQGMKDEMEKTAKAEAKKHIKSAVKAFFDEFPNVSKLKWSQYTPYFNDGDACVFGVNSVQAVLKAEAGGEEEESEDGNDSWHFSYTAEKDNNGLTAEQKKEYRRLSKALKEFDESFGKMNDALLFAFGDHVEVTCTRDEIAVDEYSHD